MKLSSLFVLLVLCTLSQAITFSTIAKVSLVLINMNKPVFGFFGMFRRRKSPPIQETNVPEGGQFSFPNQPMPGRFNPVGGFGGTFFPGFNNPAFGMFGAGPTNRFPPQFQPPRPMMTSPQKSQQGKPIQSAIPLQHSMQQVPPWHQSMQQLPPQSMQPAMLNDMDSFSDSNEVEDIPGMNTEEAESFFTLLSETDESKCISRLVCEMGANPKSGGEFGQTIVEIIGSLKDFPDGSKVSEYNDVLNIGRAEGLSACFSKFSICDEESYQLVKKSQLDDEGQNE